MTIKVTITKTYQLRNKFCLSAFSSHREKKLICTSLRIFCRKQHLWAVKSLTAGSVFNYFQGMRKETFGPSRPHSWTDWKRIPWGIHSNSHRIPWRLTHFWEQIYNYWAFLARTELFLEHLLPFPIQRRNTETGEHLLSGGVLSLQHSHPKGSCWCSFSQNLSWENVKRS